MVSGKKKLTTQKGHFFANPEVSQFGEVMFLPIQRGHILPIRRVLYFANPESPNSEGSDFCQSGGFPER